MTDIHGNTTGSIIAQNDKLRLYRENRDINRNWNNDLLFHYEHTRLRCKERYGFGLTQGDWEKLNWTVFRESKANVELDYVRNETTTVYFVNFEPLLGRRRKIRVFFNEELLCIASAIPLEDEHHNDGKRVRSELLIQRRTIRYEHGKQLAMAVSELPPIVKPVLSVVPKEPEQESKALVKALQKNTFTLHAGNAESIARDLLLSIVAPDSKTRGQVINLLVSELKSQHKRGDRATRSPPERQLDEIAAIEKVVGKSLTECTALSVPVCGVPMKIGRVFETAENNAHPLQPACAALIKRHDLVLRMGEPSGARGKAKTFVERGQRAAA